MPDTLEVRIAHLEGAYEQIDKRLTGVEMALTELRREMAQLRQQMYEQFRWIVGIQIIAWISILGTLVTLLLRS